MRKVLFLFAFAGLAAYSSLGTPAFADRILCPKTDTSEAHLKKDRSSCYSTCEDSYRKEPGTIPGCKKSCDNIYSSCVKTYQEWDKKKTECRKPIGACFEACPKGSGNQKCMDACGDKFAQELGKCAERAMQ